MQHILGYISNNDMYGIPLDVIAHFVCGAAGYWFMRILGCYPVLCVFAVLMIACLKEYHDPTPMNDLECLKDIGMTVLGCWAASLVDLDE